MVDGTPSDDSQKVCSPTDCRSVLVLMLMRNIVIMLVATAISDTSVMILVLLSPLL